MRKFSVFTWDRVLIQGAICLGSTGLVARAATYNRFQLPLGAWVSAGVALTAFWTITIWYFLTRWQWKKSIAGYTKHGVALRPGELTSRLPVGWQARVAETIESTIQFWAVRNPTKTAQIRKAFEGAYVSFYPRVLSYVDLNGMVRHAVGLQKGQYLLVVWRPDMAWHTALSLVRHEAGHLAMSAAGIPAGDNGGQDHHALMASEEFGA